MEIANCKLKNANYKLQIFNFKSQIVNCQYLIQISNLLSQTLNANREETVRFIPVGRIEIYCFDDCHGDSTKMGLCLSESKCDFVPIANYQLQRPIGNC